MLAEIFMLRVETAAREATREEVASSRFVPIMLPAVRPFDEPAHGRGRAEEARTLADQMQDDKSRETMLTIAADYERLAKHTEERARKVKPSHRWSPPQDR